MKPPVFRALCRTVEEAPMTIILAERIKVVRGDITRLDVDVIVNAANGSLLGGGGVDGAIHRAAGPGLMVECRTLDGCPTGEVRITGGHGLHAKYVIHAVGPVYQTGRHGEPDQLRLCYDNALRLAADKEAESIAFPCISTGVFGYPKADACRVATETVIGWLRRHEHPQRVIFCCFEGTDATLYRNRLRDVLEPP
jgi:O-acetyl-ADP-ribose deacetylase (regulator of RNase III)